MPLSLTIETLPLRKDGDGVVRVGETRVTLDTVVGAFCDGATAEEIIQRYPSLKLADVYHVIGFYLQRQTEVEEYLQQRSILAKAVRTQTETHFDPQGIRDRLLARLTTRDNT